MTTLKTRRLSNGIGAEILELDITRPLSVADTTAVRQALLDYNILLFRDCDLTPDSHVAFTKIFGEIESTEAVAHLRHPDHPDVVLVSNQARNGQRTNKTGRLWQLRRDMQRGCEDRSGVSADRRARHSLPYRLAVRS